VECRPVVLVDREGIGLHVEQLLCQLDMTLICNYMQRRLVIAIAGVDVDRLVDGLEEVLGVAAAHNVVEAHGADASERTTIVEHRNNHDARACECMGEWVGLIGPPHATGGWIESFLSSLVCSGVRCLFSHSLPQTHARDRSSKEHAREREPATQTRASVRVCVRDLEDSAWRLHGLVSPLTQTHTHTRYAAETRSNNHTLRCASALLLCAW